MRRYPAALEFISKSQEILGQQTTFFFSLVPFGLGKAFDSYEHILNLQSSTPDDLIMSLDSVVLEFWSSGVLNNVDGQGGLYFNSVDFSPSPSPSTTRHWCRERIAERLYRKMTLFDRELDSFLRIRDAGSLFFEEGTSIITIDNRVFTALPWIGVRVWLI